MYETAIDAVVQAGIMTGYGNGMFRPAGAIWYIFKILCTIFIFF
jgi:hypothetical protein